MKSPAPSFQEVLAEDWHIPREPQELRPLLIPEDSLLLSVQGQKAAPNATGVRKSSKPEESIREDTQGNRIRVSLEGQRLATPDNIAWETRLNRPEGK